MAVRTVNRYGIMALVYLVAFGLTDAQDNGDKEKVRIHSSKSGNVHNLPPYTCTYICITHYCFTDLMLIACIRESLFQCMKINWRKTSLIADSA
jgi:hypothetical protein